MVKFVADQNKDVFMYESGTYAVTSGTGFWIGQVQSHTIEENINIQNVRYTGTSNRNIGQFIPTAIDVNGTLTYYPQEFKILGFAMGSIVDSGSPSPYLHTYVETNSNNTNAYTSGAFLSFTVESSHQNNPTGLNHIKTVKGCTVNTYKITSSEAGIISCEAAYIAKEVVYSSGAATAVTEDTNRPFLWSDSKIHLESGTVLPSIRSWSWELNNNLNAPHYSNGSRQIDAPIPENRDYTISLTIDADTTWSKKFYEQYFKGGSAFNMLFVLSASTGSRELFIHNSGCVVSAMDDPNNNEGVVPQTITILPQSCGGFENSLIFQHNPW